MVLHAGSLLCRHSECDQDIPRLDRRSTLAQLPEPRGRTGARDGEHRNHDRGTKIHAHPPEAAPEPRGERPAVVNGKGPAPRLRSSSAARPLCPIIRAHLSLEQRAALYATRAWLTEKAAFLRIAHHLI